jgi:hypothetical protein
MLYVQQGLIIIFGGLAISLSGFIFYLCYYFCFKNKATTTQHSDVFNKYDMHGREELEDKYEK